MLQARLPDYCSRCYESMQPNVAMYWCLALCLDRTTQLQEGLAVHSFHFPGGQHFHFPPMAFQKRWQKTARPSAHTSCQALWAYVLQLPPNLHRRERLPKPNQSSACPQARIAAVGSDLTRCALM